MESPTRADRIEDDQLVEIQRRQLQQRQLRVREGRVGVLEEVVLGHGSDLSLAWPLFTTLLTRSKVPGTFPFLR